jgi:cysteine-rich secretory family protein
MSGSRDARQRYERGVNKAAGICGCLMLIASCVQGQQPAAPQNQALVSEPSKAKQLFNLANEARTATGAGSLAWDRGLADAALKHCMRMALEGPIAHRYDGEPDLTARAGAAGAHFGFVEENIAVGSNPEEIHQGWLNSPEHRVNMLNPAVDHVGIAVVASGELIFAVADFERAVPALTQTQVEAVFAQLLRARQVMVIRDTNDARNYCASAGRYSGSEPPSFLFRWQNPDVTQLPEPVVEQLATGRYHKAAVGSCVPQDVNGAFTVYRVAVLLY